MAASVGEPSISNTAGVGGMQAAAGFAGSDRNFTLARCATPLLSLARNAATASLGTAMSIAGCCGGPVAAGRRTSEPGVDPVDAKAVGLGRSTWGVCGKSWRLTSSTAATAAAAHASAPAEGAVL
eukprot:CAMPEP_0170441942 /NCGR_PEP_ID=MMETSP0117_2-20130122/47161_1 /TAXON_ID=400756 /ORGANISM="Durinskia baltica, Strain CSIRO CS-38" /LENGTH=124 /DNA_ID=CAMNT_0010702513 /DNA_START=159 /DNA_END=530 /DNA_ORIENTATION=-